MNNNKIIKLVTAGLFAAITCVVTMFLPIKIPVANGGYIHPGDAFVLLSGIILGPLYGGIAAGIGSMLSDLFLGYVIYAPATLVIKALAAIAAAYAYRHIKKGSVIISGIFVGIVVTVCYYIYECFLLGNLISPLINASFNLIQNIMGIVLGAIILPLLMKVPQIKGMIEE